MAWRPAIAALGRRLDYLPCSAAIGLGAALGAGAVAPFAFGAEAWPAWLAGSVCLAGAWRLAASAQPIAVPAAARAGPKPPLPEPPEMIELEGGVFRMGSPGDELGRDDDEGPVHEVTVSTFALAEVPTVQRLYGKIMGTNPVNRRGTTCP